MGVEITPRAPTEMTVSEREEAALLDGLLAYSPRLTPRQRRRLLVSIMRHRAMPVPRAATAPSGAELLLRPGIVQAETLALNYALLLGLDLSGSLQVSALPMEATLLAVNYLVLTGLMMALSLLCLVQAVVRWELRHVYRGLVVAMGVTGAFGLLESMVLSAPWPVAPPLKVLFLITVPLGSALLALISMARAMAAHDAVPRLATGDAGEAE